MIIRSQDKKRIANIGTCSLIAIIGSCNNTCNVTVDGMVVGTYSTEEKAIKVLDMIQNFYCKCESAKVVTSGIWDLINKYGTLEDAEKYRDDHRELFVFQMPQDSEVRNERIYRKDN